jgi:hypothetical protein
VAAWLRKITRSQHVYWVRVSLNAEGTVAEEPQEQVLQEEEGSEDVAIQDGTERPAGEAETAEVDDSEPDFEAHGSWGGIG